MAKVVIIGAGSLGFSSKLTADILSYPAMADTHFGLVDVDSERLSFAKRIAERIFKEGGYDKASVTATENRREVLKDADYVIISILVGGYPAIEKEIDIPMKYGISQCIGDTLTPGGIMRCIRTLPVIEGMVADIMELCPNAHVLNYTNPMGMLSWGITDAAPSLDYVGLCHSVQGTSQQWANRLGIDVEEVDYQCSGINHQAWFTRFDHRGKDMLPEIRKLALDPKIWYGDTTRMEYVKHFGYPVTESSGHVSEYNWWFRKDEETIKRYCPGDFSDWNGTPGFIKTLYNRPDWRERMEKMASWEEPVNLERSHEYGSRIVNAIQTRTPTVIYGNVKNHTFIDNLPQWGIVEVPCLIDQNGISPVRTGPLPPHLSSINRAQMSVQELAVEAVHQRDPEIVFQAMAMDPLTAMSCTLDEIRSMTRELMQAHQEWIPIMEGKLPKEQPLVFTMSPDGEVERHVDPGDLDAPNDAV